MTPYEQMKKRHKLEELIMIERAVIETRGNRTNAAKLLGMELRTLRHKLTQMQGEEYHAFCKKGGKEKKEYVKNTVTLEEIKEALYNLKEGLEVKKKTETILDENARRKEVEVYYTEWNGKKVRLNTEKNFRKPKAIIAELNKRGLV